MENTIVAIFVALALVIGLIGGAVLTPNEVETKIVYQDKIVEVPVNVTVEKLVEVPVLSPSMLSLAVDAFMTAVEDEEDEAGNDVSILDDMNYNFDEVSIYEISNDYNVDVSDDGDITTVNFEIRLKFVDSHDSEKETYDVTVIFENDEDTVVTIA